MVKFCKKTALFMLSLLIVAFCVAPAYASDASDTVKFFNDGGEHIICIAHRGDWHSFPENSVEAVKAASNYDVISVDVKLSSDGKPILMADETTDRMCVDFDGNLVSGSVSSFTLSQLGKLFLRQGNGGTDKVGTSCRIPELSTAINAVAGKAALMLNVSENDFNAVYEYVKSLGKLDETVFRIDAKSSRIIELTKDLDDVTVTGNYQGNIIFLATSAVKECFENGISTIEMGSDNGHGVLYDNFLMKRFDGKKRAMASMVTGRCGKRDDNETGWDDLISRGYSVIETDYPAELTRYIEKAENATTELEKFVDLYSSTDLAPYTTETESDFTDALSGATALLGTPASFTEVTNARHSLQHAYDSLTVGAKKSLTLKFNFTPGRIITVILCGAAFTAGTLYLISKRKKSNG